MSSDWLVKKNMPNFKANKNISSRNIYTHVWCDTVTYMGHTRGKHHNNTTSFINIFRITIFEDIVVVGVVYSRVDDDDDDAVIFLFKVKHEKWLWILLSGAYTSKYTLLIHFYYYNLTTNLHRIDTRKRHKNTRAK